MFVQRIVRGARKRGGTRHERLDGGSLEAATLALRLLLEDGRRRALSRFCFPEPFPREKRRRERDDW